MQEGRLRILARQTVFAVVVFLVAPALASAATYYVRTDGNNSNAGTSNSAGGAWRTVGFAVDNLAAGDTVRVQAGAYGERATPGRNGTAGSVITYIADGVVTLCGIDFTANRYIRVIGFTFDGNAAGCNGTAITANGINDRLEFWHNTFQDVDVGIDVGNGGEALNNSIFLGNVFQRVSDGSGGAIAFGTWNLNHNLIGYNEFYDNRPDAAFVMGTHNRWLNNYAHALSEAEGGHVDFFQAGSSNAGFADSLFEANFQVGTGAAADEHVTNWSNGQGENGRGFMGRNVLRRNVWHNLSGPALSINQTNDGNISPTAYYNNSTVLAMTNNRGAGYAHAAFGPIDPGLIAFNNIEYQSWTPDMSSNISVYFVEGPFTRNYNLAFDPDGAVAFNSTWTSQANARSNVNPNFNNVANDDFTLAAGSGDGANARGTGGALTTTSGSGTGTTFNVASGTGFLFRGDDPNLDQYGGQLVVGDTITVGTDVVTIASVSGDAITVTSPFTWTSGEPVYFGPDTTPDIGAYPHKSGGYALSATSSTSGGLVTVTPNDPDLVRFVVCYENGIPVAVDHSGPYTCAVGSGSIAVRVYPRYASKTLWVTTTHSTTPPPASPANLRIIR